METIKLVNLCPHTIDLLVDGVSVAQVESEGLARVACTTEDTGVIMTQFGEVKLTNNVYGEVVGLPEPTDGVRFIVSGMVKDAVPERKDLLRVGPLVRNSEGVVQHTLSLSE